MKNILKVYKFTKTEFTNLSVLTLPHLENFRIFDSGTVFDTRIDDWMSVRKKIRFRLNNYKS